MQAVTTLLLHTSPLLIYLIVAVALLLESAGVPVLNSTLLLFAAALASSGHLNIWYLAAAAIASSISGAYLAYYLGARGGRRILLRLAALFHVDRRKVSIVEHWFQRSGVWMIFFSRMTPYVRPFACFPAGIAQMNVTRFLISALSGSVIWCATMLTIGWTLGRNWSIAVYLIQQYTIPTLCVIVALIATFVLVKYAFNNYLRSRFQPASTEESGEVACYSRDLVEI